MRVTVLAIICSCAIVAVYCTALLLFYTTPPDTAVDTKLSSFAGLSPRRAVAAAAGEDGTPPSSQPTLAAHEASSALEAPQTPSPPSPDEPVRPCSCATTAGAQIGSTERAAIPAVMPASDPSPSIGPSISSSKASEPPIRQPWYLVGVVPSSPRLSFASALSGYRTPRHSLQHLAGVEYVRYSLADFDGGDLVAKPVQVLSLTELATVCNQMPGCTGFNTRGWLKAVPTKADLRPAGTEFYAKPELRARVVNPDEEVLDYLSATVQSILEETANCTKPSFFDLQSDNEYEAGVQLHIPYHFFVFDNSPPFTPHPVFERLQAKYQHMSCLTFVDDFNHIPERDEPHARPHRQLRREPDRIKQSLDILSNLHYALSHSVDPHLLLWEDDCLMCPGTLSVLGAQLQRLMSVDPHFGTLKVGNGGSGILIHKVLVQQLLQFLATLVHAENIDVSIYKYLETFRHTDYITTATYSAHQGTVSSFLSYRWGAVECGAPLDYWWGSYTTCPHEDMAKDWRCSYQDEFGGRIRQ